MCIHSNCNIEPWWLTLADIIGFEDDDDDSSDDSDSDDDDSDDSDDDTDDSGDDSDDSDDDSDDDDDDTTKEEDKPKHSDNDIRALKDALKKERKLRREAQKAAKANKAPAKDDKKAEDDKEEDKGPSDREVRLAAKLRDQEVDNAIARAIRRSKFNFADMDDVMALVNRRAIDVDQDDDDPTDIDVDMDDVEAEIARLGKKKHLLAAGKKSPPKSGSKMGGKNKNGEMSDDELRKRYSALR